MDHTYLRYECADAFGLTISSASSKAPQSNSILSFVGNNTSSTTNTNPILLTTAGSQCVGFNLRQCLPCIKLGHREHLSGGVGTGRALNSDEVVCLDTFTYTDNTARVATGWIDGAVRIFELNSNEASASGGNHGLVHSLLQRQNDDEHYGENNEDEFVMREPLVLNGHSQTPVRSIAFDRSGGGTRLASGGSDGSVVVWDIIAETGLFRLLGHRGAVTDITFLRLGGGSSRNKFDGLMTSSLDGLVKIWDLDGQCCTQTIANHRGEVWGAACMNIFSSKDQLQQQGGAEEDGSNERWRMITGSTDGQIRVWSVQQPKRTTTKSSTEATNDNSTQESDGDKIMTDTSNDNGKTDNDVTSPSSMHEDDVCQYMGSLLPPPNVATSTEKVSCIHFHPNGRYVGILHSNSKNVDIYQIRNLQESIKKKQRRLRRRREKKSSQGKTDPTHKKSGRKRGILDDPESSADEQEANKDIKDVQLDPELMKASDEFEYYGTVRASHKLKGFTFVPVKERGAGIRIACALSTNAIEIHSVVKKRSKNNGIIAVPEKVSGIDMYGHPTGIRSLTLSSDDVLACTVSKNITKVWNVANRSCIMSVAPAVPISGKRGTLTCYGLCAAFLPGNTHVILGTREGHLLILDIASGDIVYTEENAHDAAIWSIDVRRPTPEQEGIAIMTGSADKTVKFWDVEAQEEDEEDDDGAGHPMVVHTRTLEMSDDVVAVRYSHSTDPAKRMIFVSTLDCTIKVFFDDTLKFFLSLYGHKLPALALDASDDDTILASSGADKTIKIWGLDFGDTHRTLHGHEDSITDLRFVKNTHNFFTSSKDGTVRYWDGDRFHQILLLQGHCAEVNCLAVSRTGAFVVSGGMDRQVRVWERTKDIVFLEEERDRELEQMFDKVDSKGDEGGTANIMRKRTDDNDDDMDDDNDDDANNEQPQSEAAVKRSILSVSSGDRIMEGLEKADQELKDIASFRKTQGGQGKQRSPSIYLLGMEPAQYVLWLLRSIKSAELEQSLLVLPLSHVERLVYYLIILLKGGRGIEICARVAIFMIKTHQNQILSHRSMATPLRELRRLVRMRLAESRDTVGFNLAALRAIAKVAQDRKGAYFIPDEQTTNIWAGLGLGSDVAAALEKKGRKKD